MTQRIGGIFPILTRREFNTIQQAEAILLSDESFEGDTYETVGTIGNYSEGTPLEQYSVPDLLTVVDLYDGYLREGITDGIDSVDHMKSLSQEGRVKFAEYKRVNRYWLAKLQPILKKLKRVKYRLENEALS